MKQKVLVNFYLLLILAILAFGIGGYFTFKYELTKPTTVTFHTNETVNWKTYANSVLGVSFNYPIDWRLQDDNTLVSPNNFRIITITTNDFTTPGITSCAAYPKDEPRCETTKIGDVFIGIDWGDKESNTANATILISDNLGIILSLLPNPNTSNSVSIAPLTSDEKSIFRQILSTFKFIDQEAVGDFECPDAKILDCSPCTSGPCPLFNPQYCSKGSAQYNWIIENCPDVKIIGLD